MAKACQLFVICWVMQAKQQSAPVFTTSDGLSAGAIVGVVIASIAGVVIVTALLAVVMARARAKRGNNASLASAGGL